MRDKMDLLKAIRKNDIVKCEKILKKGYYVRINDSISDTQEQIPIKTIPLCLATARGQLGIVKLLLHYGADVKVWNIDWAPPIHLATYRGYMQILNYFLTECSDRDIIINSTDQLGDSPLHIAARYSKVEIVNLLLEHNADLSIVNQLNKSALDTARETYGEETDLICAAIVKKMREHASGSVRSPPSKQDTTDGGASKEYIYPGTPPLPHSNSNPRIRPGTEGKQRPSVDKVGMGVMQRPRVDSRQSNDSKSSSVESRDQIMSKLSDELKSKENEITNLEDDITTCEAERNKIKSDIMKLTERLNQQTALIKKKENDKEALEKEVVFLRKRLRPPSKLSVAPSVEEKSYECPVCLEIPLPPKHVYQCTNGHIYCSDCKDMPTMHICPQCRVPLDKQNPIRNIAFTEIIGNLFPKGAKVTDLG